MRPILLAALLMAGCGVGSDRSLPARSTVDRDGPGACTFARNPACGSTDCCEFDSVTYPGYREELVCCGAGPALFRRICSCPGCMTPCGEAGPKGCAVCGEPLPYSVSCNVHPQSVDGEVHSCGYVLDGD
jgi:hypothetical protein